MTGPNLTRRRDYGEGITLGVLGRERWHVRASATRFYVGCYGLGRARVRWLLAAGRRPRLLERGFHRCVWRDRGGRLCYGTVLGTSPAERPVFHGVVPAALVRAARRWLLAG